MNQNFKVFNQKYWVAYITLFATFLLFACEPQDEMISTDKSNRISFSPDTVFFDTLFTGFESPVRRISVKNFNDEAINISRLYLQTGENSPFRLTINGTKQQEANDIFLRGNDSLRVFLDILPPKLDSDEITKLEDFLVMESNGNTERLPIVVWLQDGILLEDSVLDCQTIWSGKKPYIIKGNVLVDENCKLTIEAGVRVSFLTNAALLVAGSLETNGTATERVTLGSFRNDESFKNALGQWFGVFFGENSRNNKISYTTIENATVGIRFGTPDSDTIPDLIIQNTEIRNMADAGVFCLNSDVVIQNTLIHNCLNRTFSAGAGGNYYFYNNTFSNFGFNFFREEPSFELSNVLAFIDTLGNEQVIREDLNAYFINNIIWGSIDEELTLFASPEAGFQTFWNANLLKTTLLDNSLPNILNQAPMFVDAFNGKYQLDSLSPAIDAGLDIGLEIDLEDNPRDSNPDIGAFERQ
ncbi:choice-of-anchor Q domain-containing protein [Bernardetia sp.]|uniref:choice-of-anchor Q domain-containing protein n=1 Tax=Bernardetia sp. TaxID=1937974 RepID=UPI0025BF7DA8|nr:choice-of-anchor Q domain-containing protein [Bernardetia sp.]